MITKRQRITSFAVYEVAGLCFLAFGFCGPALFCASIGLFCLCYEEVQ